MSCSLLEQGRKGSRGFEAGFKTGKGNSLPFLQELLCISNPFMYKVLMGSVSEGNFEGSYKVEARITGFVCYFIDIQGSSKMFIDVILSLNEPLIEVHFGVLHFFLVRSE